MPRPFRAGKRPGVLGASRVPGESARRKQAGSGSFARESPGFQVRSQGSPEGIGRRQRGGGTSERRGSHSGSGVTGQGGGRQKRTRRRGGRIDTPKGGGSASSRQTQDDSKIPLMVPPVDRSLSVRNRRKAPSVNPHRDSLIWNRSKTSNLDMRTDMGHTYLRQVFDPYIPHLQRISVFGKVSSNFQVFQEETQKRRIRVGGRQESGRSYFVGRIRVVLWRNRWTPIPSVSPEARILWYQTQPKIRLEFARDGGGLMYVRAREWKASIVRLIFGTDGANNYFGGKIPRGIQASRYSLELRPYVPFRVKYVALRRMRRFGVSRTMELHDILHRVVPYLRSFVARKLKSKEYRKNPFDTLWRSKVGVCRHRSMLFTIAMQSLGFPARMIANRAHAFVEIQFPNGQWRQIDLGGGEIPHWMGKWRGRKYKPLKDPFPRPPPSAQQRRMPTTPHPPPHAPDPQEAKRGQVRARSGITGTSKTRRTGQGSSKQGKGAGNVLLRKRVKKRKKRRPYVPHTRF